MLLESQGGTKSHTLTETKSTHIATALWNHTTTLSISVYLASVHFFFSPHFSHLVMHGWKLTHFQHIHMHTLIQSHMQNCVFWQDIKTGDYTHAADAGISLSANPVSFALERMREGERERTRVRKTKRILISAVRCVGAFVRASSACVSSLTRAQTWLN